MIAVVKNNTEITPDWLTQALKQNNVISSSVSKVEIEPIGAGVGLMAELCRLKLTYAANETAPSTMIAKCAARNENLEVAKILDFYNRETNFYNNIGSDCPLKVPESYFGAVNQDTYDCVILMEDLGDVSPRDQLVGASKEEAFSAIGNIARMHAKWWQLVDNPRSAWMFPMMSPTEAVRLKELIYLPALEPALEKFSNFFSEEMKLLCRTVGRRYDEFWAESVTPVETFVHGDYRQDNMIYKNGSLDAIVMDWQISGRGYGIFDVTYFMCQSMGVALRREIESELLEFYVARLIEAGVKNYTLDQCWQDYKYMILGCLVYPITVCGTLDTANERGRALGEAMLERNLTAIDELGCQKLVL